MSHDITQRCAAYIRVSSNEQALRGFSPAAQEDTLNRYAAEHNLRIVEWYRDLGVSGTKLIKNRPALQQMIKDAEEGLFDRIIFIKLDRYFRSPAEYYECQKRLDAKNVTWTATEEKYDLVSASGKYWVNQKLAMAEYEANLAGERVDLVNEYKVKTGQPLTGPQSLGLAYTSEKGENGIKKVVKDTKTQDAVMDYINLFITHKSKRHAQHLVNAKYGTNYGYATLAKLLTDTKIYGHYRGNDNYCEPYIDKATYDNIQEIIKNNIRVPKTKRVYLFTGLIFCPMCKTRLAASFTGSQKIYKNSGKSYEYQREYYAYRCNLHTRDKLCKFKPRVSEKTLEKKLLAEFEQYVTSYIDNVRIEEVKTKEPSDLKDKIAQLKGEMTRLNNMYQKNRITEEQYDKDYDDLKVQLNALESHLEPVVERDLTKYEELLKSDWKDIYAALTKENKRAFWHKFIKEIVVDEKGKFKDIIFF